MAHVTVLPQGGLASSVRKNATQHVLVETAKKIARVVSMKRVVGLMVSARALRAKQE